MAMMLVQTVTMTSYGYDRDTQKLSAGRKSYIIYSYDTGANYQQEKLWLWHPPNLQRRLKHHINTMLVTLLSPELASTHIVLRQDRI